jgi:hypothetical protein
MPHKYATGFCGMATGKANIFPTPEIPSLQAIDFHFSVIFE